MAKLRKMLGDMQSAECLSLMKLIETQSQKTLAMWAICYAKLHYLPIYEQECPTQSRLRELVAICESYLSGDMKLSEVKAFLKEISQIPKETEDNPVAMAAARAVATACATIKTPTNAFGFLLYGAAAMAYSKAGLEGSTAVYDNLATLELSQALESLSQTAVSNETSPVKINWHC